MTEFYSELKAPDFIIRETASIAVPRMPQWLLSFWPCKVYRATLVLTRSPGNGARVDTTNWTEAT